MKLQYPTQGRFFSCLIDARVYPSYNYHNSIRPAWARRNKRNAYKFVTLVVSALIAILLASALNNFSRVSDSALADNSFLLQSGGRVGDGGNAPTTAKRDYLPIIFLNSATAGGAWLLSGNAGTNPANDFLGTTDNITLTLRVSNTVAFRLAVLATYVIRGVSPKDGHVCYTG